MFPILIIIFIIWKLNSNQHKRDQNFTNVLLNLKNKGNIDDLTIDAVLFAYTLTRNIKTPFKTIWAKTEDVLKRTQQPNTNHEKTQSMEIDELNGQLNLLSEDIFAQKPNYTPPTPFEQQTQPLKNIPQIMTDKVKDYIPAPQQMIKPIKPIKPAIVLDTSSIVLILGVILVLTSAIIFSTTIWGSVGSLAKIGILACLGAINFLISFAFYKRFENKSPSTAFYVMGYSFVSFCAITFGFFYISTDITKMFVEVGWLLSLAMFTSLISYFSFYGYKIYKHKTFLWVSLFCTDIILFTLSKAFFNNINIVLLILALYAVLLVCMLSFDKMPNVKPIILDFSKINLLIISFISIGATGTNIFTVLICGILAGGYLLSNKSEVSWNNDTSAILFCVLMMTGLFKSGFGNGVNIAFLMLTMLPVLVFVFKMMNLLEDELQQKLNFVTLTASFFIFISNSLFLFATEPNLYSILTMIILFVAITLLNTLSYYKYIHPILITAIIGEIHRYINYYDLMNSSLASFNISMIVFGIFLFYTLCRKYPLSTYVSQNVFPLFIYFICMNTEYIRPLSQQDHVFTVYYTMIVIGSYVINAMHEKDVRNQYVYTSIATLFSVFLMPPIVKLIPNVTMTYSVVLAIFVVVLAALIYYLKSIDLVKKFILPINTIYVLLMQIEFFTNTLWLDFELKRTVGYNLELVFLFMSLSILYVSQRYTQEKNFTLKYIFPYLLCIDAIIVITNNVNNQLDLFFHILIAIVSLATILIKPNSSFQLPFNTTIFATIVLFFLAYTDYFNYILLVAVMLYYIYQLCKSFVANEINNPSNLYIFVLLSFLCLVAPSFTIAQIMLTLLSIAYVYISSKNMFIQHIETTKHLNNIILNILLFIKATQPLNRDNVLLQVLVCGLSLVAITLISGRNNFISGIGIFSMYFFSTNSLYRVLYPLVGDELAMVIPIFTINIILYLNKFVTIEGFNRLTQKSIYEKTGTSFNFGKFALNIPLSSIDFYSFVGIIGVFSLFSEGYMSNSFLMLALYFLNFTRRGLHDNALVTGACASLSLALMSQELLDIPRLIRTEYNLIIIIAFIFALRYIWKEKLPPITYFFTMIGNILVLFNDVMIYKETFDAILLGIGLIGLLLFGLYVQRLRIVVLSVTSVLLLITYISFAFWNSPYWFAYLILTGIFLISLSLRIESKKRKTKE